MQTLESLRPNVSLKQAQELLSTDGLRGVFRYLRLGRFRSLAQVYIPFEVFELEIHRNGKAEGGSIAVDAVNGTLDPYSFERPSCADDCVAVETRNALPRLLPASDSQKNAEQQVRRLLYQRGFFRIFALEIRAKQRRAIYVPYWVGFYGSDSNLRLEVIDAVRRRVEGAKIKVLVQQWLTGELSSQQHRESIAAAS